MPSDLSSYLADRYLVADTKPSKKRKRKGAGAASSSSGLIIADDDESGWTKPNASNADDDEDGPTTVAGSSAEFRKAKKSGWKTVGAPAPTSAEASAADAILRQAAAENEAARRAAEEGDAPVVAGEDEDGDVDMEMEGVVKMSDGTHAGLQKASSLVAQREKHKRREKAEWEKQRKNMTEEAETIYRDATGRRVDVSMKRAEARREAEEAVEKQRLAKEAQGGAVQRAEKDRRREELEDAKFLTVARRADDEDMNRELKEKERWNDPMAQFMTEKQDTSGAVGKPGRRSRRPEYKGPAPPNRYGIRPGYRWDGVDRSNGFEAERFKAINRRERNKGLEYSWQMDE